MSSVIIVCSGLRDGVQRLEITTRVTLGVLALASGVYTYLGVRDLLNGNADHRVLRRGDLFGRGLDRHLRVLDLPDAVPAACAPSRSAAVCCSAAWRSAR